MSGDWFEEAMKDLEAVEDPDDVDTSFDEDDSETAEESPTDDAEHSQQEPTAETTEPVAGESVETTDHDGDAVDETETDDAKTDDIAAGETAAEPTDDSSDGGAGELDDVTAATDNSDPFGFGGDGGGGTDSPPSNAQAADEFDADSGAVDEFGFSTEADATSADEPTSADSPNREPTTQPEPSMAQSAEEFGFSIGDSADSSAAEPPTDSESPEPSTPLQSGSPEPTVEEPPSDDSDVELPSDESDVEPPADEPDDDPFGFGSSGAAGGGSTPTMEGGDDDFGFGGFGGGGGTAAASTPEEFDDEGFESDIDRIDLGIEGLDDMILGGVPERSLIGIIGGAGTGKTTFALQFLNKALTQGQRAVFITLEQTEEAVLSTAEEKGWPFRQYVEDDMLAIVVLDPVEMANSLASIRGDISRLIREFGASRLVLDSVSLLEMMYDHPAKRRSEVFDFTRSLKNAGVTTLLTSEASEDSSHASRYGAVEYLTDAVFILRYVRTSNFEETRLAIEIQKIRDANHSRATKPYDLTDEGMSVHKQANIF